MQKTGQRILGDEILFAAENMSGEFAFVDIAADGGDVRMEEFCDLFNSIKFGLCGHCSPMNFLILYRVRS